MVAEAADRLGGLQILVNNVAYQKPVDDFADLDEAQWRRTFAVNIDSFYHVTHAALEHLPPGGSSIINTSSINGLRGNKTLIDYAATKGGRPGADVFARTVVAGERDSSQLCGAGGRCGPPR